MNKKICIIVLVFIFLIPVQATANFVYHSGVVTGKLKGFSKLGQYCEDKVFVDCTAAKYKQADYNVYQPLREMKLRVYINNRLAGQGSTNTLGEYTVNWFYAADASTNFAPPYILKIQTTLQHKEGRFQAWDSDGTPHYYWGTTSVVMGGTTSANPQNLGTWYWGTANSPHATMQVYEAAWRTWYYAFRHSNRLRNHFNNLKIIDSGAINAFYADEFELKIYTSHAYSIISHELGHAASYKASNGQSFKFAAQYCYPSTVEGAGQNCNSSANKGHGPSTNEWASAQFEEGLATFLGNVSSYWSQSHMPFACEGSFGFLACPFFHPKTIRLEKSGPFQSGSNVSRKEQDVAKYLRDLYDTNSSLEGAELTDLNLYHIVDSINDFTNSYENGGKNEPWATIVQPDELDGRSAKDFQHYIDIVGNISSTQSQQLYQMNANPAGVY